MEYKESYSVLFLLSFIYLPVTLQISSAERNNYNDTSVAFEGDSGQVNCNSGDKSSHYWSFKGSVIHSCYQRGRLISLPLNRPGSAEILRGEQYKCNVLKDRYKIVISPQEPWKSTLQISDISLHHGGIYTCKVGDSQILTKPKIIVIGKDPVCNQDANGLHSCAFSFSGNLTDVTVEVRENSNKQCQIFRQNVDGEAGQYKCSFTTNEETSDCRFHFRSDYGSISSRYIRCLPETHSLESVTGFSCTEHLEYEHNSNEELIITLNCTVKDQDVKPTDLNCTKDGLKLNNSIRSFRTTSSKYTKLSLRDTIQACSESVNFYSCEALINDSLVQKHFIETSCSLNISDLKVLRSSCTLPYMNFKIYEGRNVTLPCSFKSNSTNEMGLLFTNSECIHCITSENILAKVCDQELNVKYLSKSSRFQFRKQSSNEVSLRIENVSARDAGTYNCKVNVFGSYWRDIQIYNVVVVKNLLVSEGGEIEIRCHSHAKETSKVQILYKDRMESSSTNIELIHKFGNQNRIKNTIFIQSEWTIRLSVIQLDDAGIYTCQFIDTNESTNAIMEYLVTVVALASDRRHLQEFPVPFNTYTIREEDYLVTTNETIRIPCRVKSGIASEIRITYKQCENCNTSLENDVINKNGLQINDIRRRFSDRRGSDTDVELEIRQAQSSDAGVYTCKLYTDGIPGQVLAVYSVTVTDYNGFSANIQLVIITVGAVLVIILSIVVISCAVGLRRRTNKGRHVDDEINKIIQTPPISDTKHSTDNKDEAEYIEIMDDMVKDAIYTSLSKQSRVIPLPPVYHELRLKTNIEINAEQRTKPDIPTADYDGCNLTL